MFDRTGTEVISPSQVNETRARRAGLSRLWSGTLVAAGTYGFVDTVYFTCEEVSTPTHPHGGSVWALDAVSGDLRAVPALGRGSWENVAPLETGDPDVVALLLGDDEPGAPLYLYRGRKKKGGFLERNGLAEGELHAWKANDGAKQPGDFHGEGQVREGVFVPLTVRDLGKAGQGGYDPRGYANDATLRAEAKAAGCFAFSRPEDLTTDPADGTRVVLASCGRGTLHPVDNWGTVYLIRVGFPKAEVRILHDADGRPVPDEAIRSPDNVTWSRDGSIFVQEDRATQPSSLFGSASGAEASIWRLRATDGTFERIAQIDRSAVPAGETDGGAGEIGYWETSGILDVSALLGAAPGETLLLADVQAHGIHDGAIGGSSKLVEGGQLILIASPRP